MVLWAAPKQNKKAKQSLDNLTLFDNLSSSCVVVGSSHARVYNFVFDLGVVLALRFHQISVCGICELDLNMFMFDQHVLWRTPIVFDPGWPKNMNRHRHNNKFSLFFFCFLFNLTFTHSPGYGVSCVFNRPSHPFHILVIRLYCLKIFWPFFFLRLIPLVTIGVCFSVVF